MVPSSSSSCLFLLQPLSTHVKALAGVILAELSQPVNLQSQQMLFHLSNLRNAAAVKALSFKLQMHAGKRVSILRMRLSVKP